MIKGLMIAGMCAMGGLGVTQSTIKVGETEIDVQREFTHCQCSNDVISHCEARFVGKEATYREKPDGTYEKVQNI